MNLMSMFACSLFKRQYNVRLWGWLRWHNEHSDLSFLQFWSMLISQLRGGEEKYNNCGVVDHSPPPPTEGGEYTYKISLGVIAEGLCCHLLSCCTERGHWSHLSLSQSCCCLHLTEKGCYSDRFFSSSYFFFFNLNDIRTEEWAKRADSSDYCSHAWLHFMYSISQLQPLCLKL